MRIVYGHVQLFGLNAHNICANMGLNGHSLVYNAVLVNIRQGVQIFVFVSNL